MAARRISSKWLVAFLLLALISVAVGVFFRSTPAPEKNKDDDSSFSTPAPEKNKDDDSSFAARIPRARIAPVDHAWALIDHAWALSPDGKWIAARRGRSVLVFDTGTNKVVAELPEFARGAALALEFSPDGKWLAGVGAVLNTSKWRWEGPEIKVWNLVSREGHTLLDRPGADSPSRAVFGPDSKTLLATLDGETHQWEVPGGQLKRKFLGSFSSMSPDRKMLATCDEKAEVTWLWELSSGRKLRDFHPAVFLTFHPDGALVATVGFDSVVRLWNTETGKSLKILDPHVAVFKRPAGIDPRVVELSRRLNGSVERPELAVPSVWFRDARNEISNMGATPIPPPGPARFSPDGKFLAASYGEVTHLWSVENGKFLGQPGDVASGKQLQHSLGFGHSLKGPLTPDGKTFFTHTGNSIRQWDAATGREQGALEGHGVVAFSGVGQLVTGGPHTVRLWDCKNAQEVLSLKGHTKGVTGVAFSPDGKHILTGSHDGTARVWDADWGTEGLSLRGHINGVSSVAWSPDGKRILTGSWDNTAKVWDAKTGREIHTLPGRTSTVGSVAFSPNGKRILTGSSVIDPQKKTTVAGEVTIWDADTGQMVLSFTGHTNSLYSVAYSPDGKRILTGSHDGTVKVWDARTGEEVLSLKRVPSVSVHGALSQARSVAYSPDGKHIFIGSDDGMGRVWDAQTGKEVRSFKGHRETLEHVAYSPDGERILSGSHDGAVKVWDAKTGKEVLNLNGHTRKMRDDGGVNAGLVSTGHTVAVTSVAFSPDGKRILSGSHDRTAKVWDARTGKKLLTIPGHSDGGWDTTPGREDRNVGGHPLGVRSAAFSFDGKRIVTAASWEGSSKDLNDRPPDSVPDTVRVWDAQTGHLKLSLEGFAHRVNSVAFSPNGQRLVTGSAELKVWDAEKGQELLSLKGHTQPVTSVAFSTDSTRIVSGSGDRTVKVWDADNGRELLTLEGHKGPVTCVAYSPDSKHILSGSHDRAVKVWDAQTGRELLSLEGHNGQVTCLAFSPDGKRIAVGCSGLAMEDNTWKVWGTKEVKVWDAETGREVLSLQGHSKIVTSVAFSPDGKTLASVGEQVLLWDVSPTK